MDSTWALKSCTWRGEEGSSTRDCTFLLFKIWSSFLAFRSSTLTSALLRRNSLKIGERQKTEVHNTCPTTAIGTYVDVLALILELVEPISAVAGG